VPGVAAAGGAVDDEPPPVELPAVGEAVLAVPEPDAVLVAGADVPPGRAKSNAGVLSSVARNDCTDCVGESVFANENAVPS
jgi:hypothetical protein